MVAPSPTASAAAATAAGAVAHRAAAAAETPDRGGAPSGVCRPPPLPRLTALASAPLPLSTAAAAADGGGGGATPAGGPPVTAVDWQTPGHGTPIADLAYFCGAGLEPEERRDQEASLIGVYVEALSSHGVDADEGWVWEQYRRDAFAGVIMSVIASQVVGGSDRSEAMFAAMASRHLQHCLDLDSLDAVGGD
mgnify:CR=1 FL=1